MKLSIIVTHYKNPELLRACLNSIEKSLEFFHEEYEIIVSDSETIEETTIMMREDFPKISFLPSKENIGFAGTLNKGFPKTKGSYILILNGDIIVKKDSIEKLFKFVAGRENVGMAGPQLINFNETPQISCFRFYDPLIIIYRRTFLGNLKFAKKRLDYFLMKDYDRKEPKEVDWIMGSAMMTSRKAIEKVGLMDEKFKLYMEDTDWCRRFWENGFNVMFYPYSQMYHYHGKGSANKSVFVSLFTNRLTWLHIKSAARYFKKYWRKPLPKHR